MCYVCAHCIMCSLEIDTMKSYRKIKWVILLNSFEFFVCRAFQLNVELSFVHWVNEKKKRRCIHIYDTTHGTRHTRLNKFCIIIIAMNTFFLSFFIEISAKSILHYLFLWLNESSHWCNSKQFLNSHQAPSVIHEDFNLYRTEKKKHHQ